METIYVISGRHAGRGRDLAAPRRARVLYDTLCMTVAGSWWAGGGAASVALYLRTDYATHRATARPSVTAVPVDHARATSLVGE